MIRLFKPLTLAALIPLLFSFTLGSGISSYLPTVKYDEFNPDANTSGESPLEPVRGGKLRIRTPADTANLNAILSQLQDDNHKILLMSDSLVDLDSEILEYYPEMAWTWSEQDLLKKKGEDPIEGVILEESDTSVVFVPDARRWTFLKSELKDSNEDQQKIVLKEHLEEKEFNGKLSHLQHTVKINEAYSEEFESKKIEVPIEELDTFEFSLPGYTETRPFLKKQVVFEFFLRPEVKWSDGQPFTAEDVKFSFETIKNPYVDAQNLINYYEDFDECLIGEDGKSVKFVARKTYFQALDFLGGKRGQSYFIPKHIFAPEQFGGDEKAFAESFNTHEFNNAPIYTGPFKFNQWKPKDTLSLVRNENYWKEELPEGTFPNWKKGMPYLDELEWILYQESAAVIKDLTRGVIHADFDVEPTTWVQNETNSTDFLNSMVRAEKVGMLYTYIGWDLSNPIFEDVNVRKALAMLIPRKQIAQNVHFGVAFPVNGPFYVNGPGYDDSIEPLPHDVREARKLLARSGWLDRDRDGVLEKKLNGETVPLEFQYAIHNARDYHQKIADIVKERIEQIGGKVTIDKSDWTIFYKKIEEKNFDSFRFAWGTPIEPDPFQIWHSSQIENKGSNYVGFKNDRVDELCVKIRETLDPEKRWEMAREVHRIIYEEQPYCFLFGFNENYFYHRNLRGVKLYPDMYTHNFAEWWWARKPQ